jgi:hypothetical protein
MTMDGADIVSGNKEALIGEFKGMYPIHGRKWRSKLKDLNEWHKTDKGLLAWQNISRGTVGNESLRLILQDMKKILEGDAKEKILKRQGLTKSTKR